MSVPAVLHGRLQAAPSGLESASEVGRRLEGEHTAAQQAK